MPSQDAAACLCGNTRPVAVECESVCRGCGVVLGVERHPEGPGTGRLSLFLRLENGGRAAALPGRTKKLHIHGSDMGTVSDVCAKLSIRGAASVDVWRTYRMVLAMGVSKAAAACFAVYYVCRRSIRAARRAAGVLPVMARLHLPSPACILAFPCQPANREDAVAARRIHDILRAATRDGERHRVSL